MDDIMKDDRFAAALKSRQFMKVPCKTKVDKRFQSMFKDKGFKMKHVVDKRGRPVEHHSSEDLKKFYDVSSEEEEDVDSEEEDDVDNASLLSENENKLKEKSGKEVNAAKIRNETDSDDHEDESDNSNLEQDDKEDESSSESESTTDDDDDISELSDEFDHKWEELDAEVPATKEVTRRLAICNMDWDRIRPEDILAVFNSFKPDGSVIHSVKIYPSEYGLQRMEEEKLRGPIELVEETINEDEDGELKINSNKEGSRYHREKLRQYQINRLKYFYAVVECDTPETADSLYEQLNGMEYESSAVCLDIRFIPDDVVFDQEPKSQALEIPDASEYKPRMFINSALQQVKVNLTWDETDPKRRETLRKAFREPESIEKDIRNYLASSSSSDSEGPLEEDNNNVDHEGKIKNRIANYRALLQSLEEKEKEEEEKYEMEITWETGMKDKTKEMVKEKLQSAGLNPFEEKVKKMKEERKLKKKDKMKQMKMQKEEEFSSDEDEGSEEEDDISHEDFFSKPTNLKTKDRKNNADEKMTNELSLLMADSNETDSDGEDHRKWRKPKKTQKKVIKKGDYEAGINDPRFSAVFTSHAYNIDPSDPHFKDTERMQNMVQKKLEMKRKLEMVDSTSAGESAQKQKKLSAESQQLVNSVKLKAAFSKNRKRH